MSLTQEVFAFSTFENDAGELTRARPDLIDNDRHHEEEVDTERPKNYHFEALQVPPRKALFLSSCELVALKRGEDKNRLLDAELMLVFMFFSGHCDFSIRR
jgi:hypothetical protein